MKENNNSSEIDWNSLVTRLCLEGIGRDNYLEASTCTNFNLFPEEFLETIPNAMLDDGNCPFSPYEFFSGSDICPETCPKYSPNGMIQLNCREYEVD